MIFIEVPQNVYPQQQIALDAYAILEQSCLICHGPNGAYKEPLLIQHNALIQNGSVVPGNPDVSELYKRLITTETANRMPLGQPQLPARSINTIRNWILSGAPAWSPAVNIPDPNLRAAIEEALNKASGATITVEEMATLGGWYNPFNAGGRNISNLTGLEHATGMEQLFLQDNSISNISALANLSDLNRLDLSNNNILDLFPLVVNAEYDRGGLWVQKGDRSLRIDVAGNPLSDTSINTHIPTLRGKGVQGLYRSQLFLSTIAPVAVGETFTLDLIAKDVVSLAGWQLDIAFNPTVLKAISVNEGDFLSEDGGNTFFQEGAINNAAGTITGISGAFIGTGGVSGTGTLFSVTFEAKAAGEGSLQLSEDKLGTANGNQIHYDIVIQPVIVESTYDLNGDGKVNLLDLTLVAQNFGRANPQADANHDGTVDIFDLIAVAQHMGSTPQAPSGLAYHGATLHSTTVQKWIDMAHAADDGSFAFQLGIANLERLLAAMVPDKTALLANYPNPFNPETWIPYHLANDADVTLTIYDIKGVVVRRLEIGHQRADFYTDRSRAAYWDGYNNLGEPVGSGIYFYQLEAGDFSATRKMLILK